MNTNEQYNKRLGFNVLSIEQLQSLPATRLLAYKKKHRRVLSLFGVEWGDEDDLKLAKYCEQHLKDINDVLSTKEHVERKGKQNNGRVD